MKLSLIGVVVIGLLHGLEPGHGWPLALLYSAKTTRPTFYAFVSSGILSAAHFISSIAVVIIYVVVSAFYDFSSPILTYIAAVVLVILAIRMLTEKVVPELEGQHGHFHDNASDLEHEHTHEHPEASASTPTCTCILNGKTSTSGNLPAAHSFWGLRMRKSLRCLL